MNDLNLNPFQIQALHTYRNGAFAHLSTHRADTAMSLAKKNPDGDKLIGFILEELDDTKGDPKLAIERLINAIQRLDEVALVLHSTFGE